VYLKSHFQRRLLDASVIFLSSAIYNPRRLKRSPNHVGISSAPEANTGLWESVTQCQSTWPKVFPANFLLSSQYPIVSIHCPLPSGINGPIWIQIQSLILSVPGNINCVDILIDMNILDQSCSNNLRTVTWSVLQSEPCDCILLKNPRKVSPQWTTVDTIILSD